MALLLASLLGCGRAREDGARPPGGAPRDAARGASPGADAGAGRGGRGGAVARAPAVAVASAVLEDVPVYLEAIGTVTPLQSVVVRPRVDGELLRVFFQEGQRVRRGDLIATIDSRPFAVVLAQAEGALARDQATLANARVDRERYQALVSEGSIAAQQRDMQESRVRELEATVKADQGVVAGARLNLAYTRLEAPFDALAGLRRVDPGNLVHASDPEGIVALTQVEPIAVVFPIPEDELPAVLRHVRAGDPLPAEAYDRDGRTRLGSGNLSATDNQIDSATGTVKLKAQFANQDGALFPSQFVNVKLLIDTLRGAVVVPSSAVQRGTQGAFVYVVKEDRTVALRPVTPGPTVGEKVAITSGLESGTTVVIDGADKLREGSSVTVSAPGGRGDRSQERRGGAGAGGDAPARRPGDGAAERPGRTPGSNGAGSARGGAPGAP